MPWKSPRLTDPAPTVTSVPRARHAAGCMPRFFFRPLANSPARHPKPCPLKHIFHCGRPTPPPQRCGSILAPPAAAAQCGGVDGRASRRPDGHGCPTTAPSGTAGAGAAAGSSCLDLFFFMRCRRRRRRNQRPRSRAGAYPPPSPSSPRTGFPQPRAARGSAGSHLVPRRRAEPPPLRR